MDYFLTISTYFFPRDLDPPTQNYLGFFHFAKPLTGKKRTLNISCSQSLPSDRQVGPHVYGIGSIHKQTRSHQFLQYMVNFITIQETLFSVGRVKYRTHQGYCIVRL